MEAFRIRRGGLRDPLRSQCVAASTGYGTNGRNCTPHPEALLQAGPSAAAAERGLCRVRGSAAWYVEHRLARLVQLGIRQSRYFGRIKTRFHLWPGSHRGFFQPDLGGRQSRYDGGTGSGPSAGSAQVAGMVNSATAWLGQIWTLTLLVSALLTKSLFPRGFPSEFLEDTGTMYRMVQDYVFGSPSTAAGVLLGRSSNGRTEWKDGNGRSLKSIQEESVGSE